MEEYYKNQKFVAYLMKSKDSSQHLHQIVINFKNHSILFTLWASLLNASDLAHLRLSFK